jgi:hypothetical protein
VILICHCCHQFFLIPHYCIVCSRLLPRKWLIKKSQQHDPLIPNDWSDDTFNDIDWKSVQSSIKWKPVVQQFQLAKYAQNWTPTLHQHATQDNSIYRRCFTCSALKEDINHVLWCPSDLCDAAHTKAKIQFVNHLAKLHTPAPMANIIMTALNHWFSNLPPNLVPCLPTGHNEPNCQLHWLINNPYVHQNYIGWGHSLWGCLTLQWKSCIAEYYKVHQPGDAFNPSLWMQKTTDAIWQIFLMIWLMWNGELHGKDYEEQCAIMLHMSRDEVSRIYEEAKQYVNDAESRLLHGWLLEQILTWTRSHLDAYLATAKVILEQNIDPGWFQSFLVPLPEWYGKWGGIWYHNSVKITIYNNSIFPHSQAWTTYSRPPLYASFLHSSSIKFW